MSNPSPTPQDLIAWSLQHFPALEGRACEVEELCGGGSDRRYFRLSWAATQGADFRLVLMLYTLARPDNSRFVSATDTLQRLGVRVPNIHAFDTQRLAIWLQDLGNEDLHHHRAEPWDRRAPLYRDALTQVAALHRCSEAQLDAGTLAQLEPPFDEKLYLWEQEYFCTHFLRSHLRLQGELPSCLGEGFAWLRTHLAKQARSLIHRDFQSRNVMLARGQCWLIDHQGLRLGLPGYDLASLLFDPYVEIAQEQREELLEFHAGLLQRDLASLRAEFLQCAAQRLAQALGAYANLSINLGKPDFASHIPSALQRLIEVFAQLPALEEAAPWLRRIAAA